MARSLVLAYAFSSGPIIKDKESGTDGGDDDTHDNELSQPGARALLLVVHPAPLCFLAAAGPGVGAGKAGCL